MSIKQLRKDKEKARKKGNLKEVANCCNSLGIELQERKELEEALEEHEEEAEISKILDNNSGLAAAHRRLGEVYFELENFSEALSHHKKYLSLALEHLDKIEIQRAHATIGRTYMLQAENSVDKKLSSQYLNEAKDSFLKSLAVCKQMDSKSNKKEAAEMRCRLYHNIGLVVELNGDLYKSADMIKHALLIAEEYGFQEDSIRSCLELARIYLKLNQLDQAILEAEKALGYSLKLKLNQYIADSYFMLAQINLFREDYKLSKKNLDKAYRFRHPNDDARKLIIKWMKNVAAIRDSKIYLDKAKVHVDKKLELLDRLGDAFVDLRIFEKAIEHYENRLGIAVLEKKNDAFLAPIYSSLAQTYKDNKNYEKALSYFKKELKAQSNFNPKEAILALIEISELCLLLPEMKKEQIPHLEQALQISINSNLPRQKGLIIKELLETEMLEERKHELKNEYKILEKLHGKDFEYEAESDDDDSNNIADEEDIDLLLSSDSEFENEEKSTVASKQKRHENSCKVTRNSLGETSLHLAAKTNKKIKTVKMLIDKKHPINLKDHGGWLPIHEACNFGCLEVVKLLVEAGAWINDANLQQEKTTPLHDAILNGHLDVSLYLLQKGAKVSVKNTRGNTPLDCLDSLNEDRPFSGEDRRKYLLIRKIMLTLMNTKNLQPAERENIIKDCQNALASENVENSEQINFMPKNWEEENISPAMSSGEESTSEEDISTLNRPIIEKESATDMYKSAISSLKNRPKNNNSLSQKKVERKEALIPEEEYVGDDWLTDDIHYEKKKNRPFEFEYKEERKRSSLEKIGSDKEVQRTEKWRKREECENKIDKSKENAVKRKSREVEVRKRKSIETNSENKNNLKRKSSDSEYRGNIEKIIPLSQRNKKVKNSRASFSSETDSEIDDERYEKLKSAKSEKMKIQDRDRSSLQDRDQSNVQNRDRSTVKWCNFVSFFRFFLLI